MPSVVVGSNRMKVAPGLVGVINTFGHARANDAGSAVMYK